jgi:hypothetical protein
MISNNTFRQMALQYDKVIEMPHFEKQSYRIGGKKYLPPLMKLIAVRCLNCLILINLSFVPLTLPQFTRYPAPGVNKVQHSLS